MAGERKETACPELFDTKLHRVFVFNIESRRFKQVTTQTGALLLPKFRDLAPSEEKPILFEIRHKPGCYSYYKPLSEEDTLLKRVIIGSFSRQMPWISLDEVILVTPIIIQGLTENYQIISDYALLQRYDRLIKKEKGIIENVSL